MLIAFIIFVVSLIGIVTLFCLKYWEMRTQKIVVSRARSKADVRALEIKAWIMHIRAEAEKLPPQILSLSRYGVRDLALAIAAFARGIEKQAHRIADLVSHKRHFERKESKNSYLKRVEDYETQTPEEQKLD